MKNEEAPPKLYIFMEQADPLFPNGHSTGNVIMSVRASDKRTALMLFQKLME